jgi:hypothetical protein
MSLLIVQHCGARVQVSADIEEVSADTKGVLVAWSRFALSFGKYSELLVWLLVERIVRLVTE